MQSGLSPRLGEYSNVGRESEKAKQPSFGICGIRSIWLQVPSFPRARPRMYRREVWVAAIKVPYRGSLTYSMQFLDGSKVRGGRQSTVRGALYESTSIAAVYGTICSLERVGTMGAAQNFGTRPETSGENEVKKMAISR